VDFLKTCLRTFRSKFNWIEDFLIFYKVVDFISEIISMFGFIGKFKADVTTGFELVHQRLVTLEAKVEALFNHTKTVAAPVTAAVEAEVSTVETKATEVETAVTDAAATVEAVKSAT
jgi:hypothetical protein